MGFQYHEPEAQDYTFLEDIPEEERNFVLELVGAYLYVGASPDIADGLSDAEFQSLEKYGPAIAQFNEAVLQRGGIIPEKYHLPAGFARHLERDVIPDLKQVRSDPAARERFRTELRATLSDPDRLNNLYRSGGDSYSSMLSRARAGDGAGAGGEVPGAGGGQSRRGNRSFARGHKFRKGGRQ